MSRTLGAAYLTALDAANVRPVFLVSIELASTTLYLWSGVGDLSWDSKTWTGVGTFGEITGLPESAEVRADNVTLTLNGIPASVIANALDDVRQGRPVLIYMALLDDSGALIGSPALAVRGRVDAASIEEGAETASVRIAVENRLIDLQRPRVRRYTDADQQAEFSGDLGFEFVPSLQQLNVSWGVPGARIPIGGGGGGAGDDSGGGLLMP